MFIGCSDFPNCHHIESLTAPQDEQEPEQIACPECHKGHLVERKTRMVNLFMLVMPTRNVALL
ncbi:hypothetical protein JCM19233_7207 [Vibrio astriarenae]|nr:hypothetical protein JCM19233_7207 [Vibrio sp. C7]